MFLDTSYDWINQKMSLCEIMEFWNTPEKYVFSIVYQALKDMNMISKKLLAVNVPQHFNMKKLLKCK